MKNFEKEILYNEFHKLRKNIRIKNYVDRSKYEGELQNNLRHGKGIYHYSNSDKYIG